MCAHTDSKIGIFTRRVYSAYILTRHPLPLFRRLTVGAAIEKNFFWFYFFVSPIRFLLVFYFFIFSEFNSIGFVRLLICFSLVFNSRFNSIKVRHLILDFTFQTLHRFDSLQVLLDIYSFAILVFASEFLLASISTCFSIADSTLQLFISLTLLLVINKHLCLCEFVLCLFWLF